MQPAQFRFISAVGLQRQANSFQKTNMYVCVQELQTRFIFTAYNVSLDYSLQTNYMCSYF